MGELGTYDVTIGKIKSSETVVYRRNFTLNAIQIPASMYEAVQSAFDIAHKRDAHTLTLRRKPASGETPAGVSTPPAPSEPAAASPAPAAAGS